jgi:hypothetical protein
VPDDAPAAAPGDANVCIALVPLVTKIPALYM